VLCASGHQVTALIREQSKRKLATGCAIAVGNALDGASYSGLPQGADTFVHLVGVPHPSPAKAQQFVDIDLRSGLEAVRVAKEKSIAHFVYVSVAHPAPAMQAYIKVRTACEEAIRESGLNATILRPWYVLGPGHRWPYTLLPLYRLAEMIPATREGARRLGLVTVNEMVNALAHAVANGVSGVRVVEVPEIRSIGRSSS